MTVKVQRPQNSGVGLDVVPVEGCHDQSYEMGGRRWSTYLVTEKLQLQGYEDLAPELHQVGPGPGHGEEPAREVLDRTFPAGRIADWTRGADLHSAAGMHPRERRRMR